MSKFGTLCLTRLGPSCFQSRQLVKANLTTLLRSPSLAIRNHSKYTRMYQSGSFGRRLIYLSMAIARKSPFHVYGSDASRSRNFSNPYYGIHPFHCLSSTGELNGRLVQFFLFEIRTWARDIP